MSAARRGASPPSPGPERRRRRALAVASALLAAAAAPTACGETREQARLAALEAGIASAQASLSALSPAAAAPSLGGAPPAFRQVGAASAAAPSAVAAAASAAGPRPLSASALLGAGPDALRRWFGEPDLRRPEGDAEVQLFLGPDCALDVVLYADAGGAMRVLHAAARADGVAAVTEAECLRGIGGGAGRAAAAGHSARR